MAGKVIRIDTESLNEETASAVSSVIRLGGTLIYPSDTVYGILAACSSRSACSKVSAMKGYTNIRPFIILIPDLNTALSLVKTKENDSARLMYEYWPGPVTLVFRADTAVPDWLVSQQGTVALRVPGDTLSRTILKDSGKNLITTSANLNGQPFHLSIQDISEAITSSVDLILDSGTLTSRKPSRVIDCTGPSPIELRH